MSAVADVQATPNHDLFVRVLAQIEKHPETWNQGSWAIETDCGTAYCMAGWACVLSGLQTGGGDETSWLADGRIIADVAEDLLGISATTDNGDDLFEEWNSLDDLYRISAERLGLDETVLREKVAAEVAGAATLSPFDCDHCDTPIVGEPYIDRGDLEIGRTAANASRYCNAKCAGNASTEWEDVL